MIDLILELLLQSYTEKIYPKARICEILNFGVLSTQGIVQSLLCRSSSLKKRNFAQKDFLIGI